MFHFVIKKKEKGPETGFLFFFNDSDIFLKYFNSNHNLPSYSLFSKCFSWFFYLGVHRGTGVFWWLFFYFFLLLSHTWPALALASRLPPFDRKSLKNCACSAVQAFSMKLRVHRFFNLVSLYIKTDCKNKLFFKKTHQHSDKQVFLRVSRE